MPMVDLLSIGSVGTRPRRVRWSIGTSMAIVCTLAWASASTPAALAVGIRCSDWKGRSVARSKIDPRSTKNPSARCPQNTRPPPSRLVTAASASAE